MTKRKEGDEPCDDEHVSDETTGGEPSEEYQRLDEFARKLMQVPSEEIEGVENPRDEETEEPDETDEPRDWRGPSPH
jgi:hypothetical protein